MLQNFSSTTANVLFIQVTFGDCTPEIIIYIIVVVFGITKHRNQVCETLWFNYTGRKGGTF